MIRSLLYVPASSERFVARAHEREADAIIADLEDGVAPAEKVSARANIGSVVTSVGRNGATVFVRINSETERLNLDAEAACRTAAVGLLVPKVKSPQTLTDLADFLAPIERALGREPLRFIPMIEDPAAVLDARAIASATPRNLGLMIGGEDLAMEMSADPSSETVRLCSMLVHLAAKAAGIMSFGLLRSIADFRDLVGVAASAREARMLGFDGASCVHPAVVPVLNKAFSPSDADIDRARRLVATFEASIAQGAGACTFEGKMVDMPVYERARRLVLQESAKR